MLLLDPRPLGTLLLLPGLLLHTPTLPLTRRVSAPFQLVRQPLLEYLGQQKTSPSISGPTSPTSHCLRALITAASFPS